MKSDVSTDAYGRSINGAMSVGGAGTASLAPTAEPEALLDAAL